MNHYGNNGKQKREYVLIDCKHTCWLANIRYEFIVAFQTDKLYSIWFGLTLIDLINMFHHGGTFIKMALMLTPQNTN